MKRYHCTQCPNSMESDEAVLRANCFLCDVPMIQESDETEAKRAKE
jgi:DNA-directed RNA polymerase subunit RPC12/RpoP